MLNNHQTILNFSDFETLFKSLIGNKVTKWYRVTGSLLNIHLGTEHKNTNNKKLEFDFSLYISGNWEFLNSGKEDLASYNSPKEIDQYIETKQLGEVTEVQFFEDTLELFIKFSSDLTFHVSAEVGDHEPNFISLHKYNEYAIHLTDIDKKEFLRNE